MTELVNRTVQILLVEDNPADIRFVRQALEESRSTARLEVVSDGEAALAFLYRTGSYADADRPDLVVLDLHMPKTHGHDVLAEIKTDPRLSSIPVVVFSASTTDEDVAGAYARHANCYIAKPFDLDDYIGVIHDIERFWLGRVALPAS